MRRRMSTLAALPEDALAAVLALLPARSLAASRCVCKAWRALVDEHRLLLPHLLPHSVAGLFVNYRNRRTPRFFARPASPSTAAGGVARIDGDFSSIIAPPEDAIGCYSVVTDHCNGLVLLSCRHRDGVTDDLYACNPATRRRTLLPPCAGDEYGWTPRRACLAFDPAVSPHYYEVLLVPPGPTSRQIDDSRGRMQWPPAAWTWHKFSSRSGRWEQTVFRRDGEGAGAVERLKLGGGLGLPADFGHRWRYAAYWLGALYVHCHGEFVSRLSLSDDRYQVIQLPGDLPEGYEYSSSFLGKSEKGVYFAVIHRENFDKHLMVWTLNDQTGCWSLRHRIELKPTTWWEGRYNYCGKLKRWSRSLVDVYTGEEKRVLLTETNVDWSSDDEDVTDLTDEECYWEQEVDFLGIHPYKEIIFLSAYRYVGVACHLNSGKIQCLGIYAGGTYPAVIGSFVFTPCLIGD